MSRPKTVKSLCGFDKKPCAETGLDKCTSCERNKKVVITHREPKEIPKTEQVEITRWF